MKVVEGSSLTINFVAVTTIRFGSSYAILFLGLYQLSLTIKFAIFLNQTTSNFEFISEKKKLINKHFVCILTEVFLLNIF